MIKNHFLVRSGLILLLLYFLPFILCRSNLMIRWLFFYLMAAWSLMMAIAGITEGIWRAVQCWLRAGGLNRFSISWQWSLRRRGLLSLLFVIFMIWVLRHINYSYILWSNYCDFIYFYFQLFSFFGNFPSLLFWQHFLFKESKIDQLTSNDFLTLLSILNLYLLNSLLLKWKKSNPLPITRRNQTISAQLRTRTDK